MSTITEIILTNDESFKTKKEIDEFNSTNFPRPIENAAVSIKEGNVQQSVRTLISSRMIAFTKEERESPSDKVTEFRNKLNNINNKMQLAQNHSRELGVTRHFLNDVKAVQSDIELMTGIERRCHV